jgi:2-C-methyl-D-erythritol 4-phosphate cytidylyltransferase
VIVALIPAAGIGSRLGRSGPKQYCEVAGRPLIAYAIEALANTDAVNCTYVVVAPEDERFDRLEFHVPDTRSPRVLRVGGKTRHESVLNGLDALSDVLSPQDWVLVHDAARPGLTSAFITQFIQALAADAVGGLVALPLADTLKREVAAQDQSRAEATLSRIGLWQAQTPQMFRYGMLRHALRSALERQLSVTDEASAIEAQGLAPRLVRGSWRNFKITYPDDLELAEMMLKGEGR